MFSLIRVQFYLTDLHSLLIIKVNLSSVLNQILHLALEINKFEILTKLYIDRIVICI